MGRAIGRDGGKTRHQMGREAFLERVWQWKQLYGGAILSGLVVFSERIAFILTRIGGS